MQLFPSAGHVWGQPLNEGLVPQRGRLRWLHPSVGTTCSLLTAQFALWLWEHKADALNVGHVLETLALGVPGWADSWDEAPITAGALLVRDLGSLVLLYTKQATDKTPNSAMDKRATRSP